MACCQLQDMREHLSVPARCRHSAGCAARARGASTPGRPSRGHSCGRYSEETSARVDEAQRNVKRYTACPETPSTCTMQVLSRNGQSVAVLAGAAAPRLGARPLPTRKHTLGLHLWPLWLGMLRH